MTRSALLVGSLPFSDEEECMRRSLSALGPSLRSLPDGEIGDKTPRFPRGNRGAWVMSAVEVLTSDTEGWRIVTSAERDAEDGLATDYTHIQKLAPRRPPAAMAKTVRFGYDGYFRKSYEAFKEIRREQGLGNIKFQVGVPTGFALGLAFASKLDWIRYTGAMNTVIAREVDAILQEAGDDVVIQVEVPPEIYAAHALPTPLLGLALRPIVDLLGKIQRPAELGVHLCLGDFRNEALVHPKTLLKLTAFSNALVRAWPERHRLSYVHFPLAAGATPPPVSAAWYAPLARARLPQGARFVAGFVHEGRSAAELRRILATIEEARGEQVDIASSCGLGRRSPEVAERLLAMTAELLAS